MQYSASTMMRITKFGLGLLCLLPVLRAQDDAQFLKKQAQALNKYAQAAFRAGFPSIARPILLEILSEYDRDDADARKGLGYIRFGTTWAPKPGYSFPEAENPNSAAANSLRAKWEAVAKKVGTAHKERGQACSESGLKDQAKYHFSRALRFMPADPELPGLLGHKSFAGMSGSEVEEILFSRSRMMDEVVKTQLKKKYPVEAVPNAEQLSIVKKAGLTCKCVKSENFTVWGEWDEEILMEAARHTERSFAFCKEAFTGHARFSERNVVTKIFVYLNGREHYKKLLEANRDLFGSEDQFQFTLKNTGLTALRADEGSCRVQGARGPAVIYDCAVRTPAVQYSGMRCDAGREGVGHAVVGRFFRQNLIFNVALEKTRTVTNRNRKLLLPDMETWKELALEAAFNLRGTKAARLPLLKASHFPTDGRIKAWSFCDYLLRRDPKLLLELDRTRSSKNEEAVAKWFESSTGVGLDQLEKEWRDFWTGATPVLRALRRKADTLRAASKDAGKWLAQLNRLRVEFKSKEWTEPVEVSWNSGYSLRCKQHAEYLKRNRRERGPALEQFQQEGKPGATRAGRGFSRMALVSTKGGPAVAMKNWIHLPGYRDALLNPYLKSVGIYALGPIAVMDVVRGIEAPRKNRKNRVWPAHDSKGSDREIAVKLLGPEVQLILKEGKRKSKKIGYPLSVHGYLAGAFPRDLLCEVKAGEQEIEGFIIVGGWNRRTSAPGMATFYPFDPLPPSAMINVRFYKVIKGSARNFSNWRFWTK